MGKSVRKVDPFAYKPEYGEQITQQAAAPKSADDPFAFKPEYSSEVKKKVGGNEFQIESPSPSQLYSESPSGADFVKKDIEVNNILPAFDLQGQPNFNSVDKRAETQKLQQTILSSPETLQGYTKSRIETLNNNIKELELSKRDYRRKIDMAFEGGSQPERSWYDAIKQIDQTVKQRQDYVNQLKGGVADVVSDMVVNRMEPGNFNPREYGRKIIEVADPDLMATIRMAEKNGGTLPGILSAKMERMGLEAAKKYLLKNPTIPDAELLSQTINNYEKDFDSRNVELTAQRVREKIGAQLYKEGKSAWFGFGYSPETLQQAINNPATNLSESEKIIAQQNVLPTERKIIGTNIPTSGFTRGVFNAVEKSAINTGKSIGAMTGFRNESEQAQELLNAEVEESRYRVAGQSPSAMGELEYLNQKQKTGKLTKQEETQKKELENYVGVRNNWSKFKDVTGDLTGQVLEMALMAKGLGGAGRLLQASGAQGGLLGGMTRTAVGQALSNETVGLFVGGYLNSYDSYKKQAIELMPGEDKAAEREAYAKVMAGVEGLSEQIFKDTKVLGAITKEVAPTIRTLTGKLLSQEITQAVAREELQGLMAKTIKPFMKDALKADLQESTEEAVVDIAQGIADSVFTGKDFDAYQVGQQALNTFLTTAMGGGIISGLAAHGAMKQRNSQNAYMKSAIMDMGANPAPYLKSVEDLQLDGTITQNEANEKIKLIKSASNALNELPETRQIIKKEGNATISEERPFDYPELNSYLIHRLNEGILTEKINNTTDEVLKSQLEKNLKRSQDIRKGIYDGSLGVTGDLQEVTDNPEKAQELGIADANQLPSQELIGTPFSRENIIKESDIYEILSEMQGAPSETGKSEILRQVSQRIYETMEKTQPELFKSGRASKNQLSEEIERTFKEEGDNKNPLRNLPESQIRDASRRLYEALRSKMVMSEMPLKSSQTKESSASVMEDKDTSLSTTTPSKEISNHENIIQNAIDAGKMPGVFEEVAKNDPEQFLKFVADQAFGRDEKGEVVKGTEAEKDVRKNYGDELVDYAKELFPITQNTQTNEEVSSQEAIPEEGNQETGGQQEGQSAGQENDEEGDVLLTEQGAEPEAEAPLTEPSADAPLSGIKHKATEETRKEFGFESYEKSVKRDEELEAHAEAEIKKGYDIEALVSKIQKGIIPTDVENTILKKYKATLEAKIAKDPSDENLDELKQLVQATDKIGSETGRALRSRQGMELRDDSLAAFFIQDTYSNLQAPLTEKQKETVIKDHEEINDLQAQYDAKIAALKAENAKLRAEQAIKKVKSSVKKEKKSHEDYVKERKDAIEAAKEKLKQLRGGSQVTIIPYANELFAIAPEVAKVVKSLVEEGTSNLVDITKNVLDTFKEIVPELTEEDVNSIIAGEYNAPRKTKSETAAILRDLRDEAALINKLDALLNGEEPKEERKKIKRNQQIETLRQKIKDLKEEKANVIREEKEREKQEEREQRAKEKEANKKSPEQKALQTLKARNKNEIAKLEEQLRNNDFEKEDKKPLELDKEAIEIKDKLIKRRQERAVRLLRMEYANRSKIRKFFDVAGRVIGVPRSLMASLDFSAPLRQAAIVTVSNPSVAASAGLEMFKQAFSQNRFDRWFYDIQESERYQLMQQAGLYVADPHDPRMSVREEQFMSNLAEKIPIVGKLVKGSERAYISYLNKMRVDLFNRYADAFENDGFNWDNNPDLYKGLASFLNNSTGRGDLGALQVAAPILNSAFFSPRLMASRINILGLNPTYYAKLPPQIRKEAFKSLAIFIGAGVTIMTLLSLAFGCDEEDDDNSNCVSVEIDPRSSDFGKIRVGRTRWDIWGGFQQYVRIVSQFLSGEKKSLSGTISDLDGKGIRKDRVEQVGSFFRGKLAPVPSLAFDLISGEDVLGRKVDPKDAIITRFTPLMLSDLTAAVKETGVRAIFTQGIPATFGVGVQNYLPQGYEKKDMKDPVYQFLYDKNLNLSTPEKKKEMSDEQYKTFLKAREPIIREEWATALQYGIMINEKGNPTIDENAAVKIVPANKATYEQLSGLMKSIGTKASREVLKEE